MNILHVTSTDPAGSVINLVDAINHHTKHRARLITTARINTYNFRPDISDIFDCGDEIEALLKQADVIHLHKVDEEFEIKVPLPKNGLTRTFKMKDYMTKSNKIIYHVHGHPYERERTSECAENYKMRGGKVLASTPDLEEMFGAYYENVSYFPNCVPINDVRYLPRATDEMVLIANGERKLIVGQTPTNSVLKDVRIIQDVISRLGKTYPVIYLKVMQVEQDTALRHKRNMHVVFDHMQGYYGLSSLEGLSMGKPTIAGLSDYCVKAISDFFCVEGSSLPWLRVLTSEELETTLVSFLTDEARRLELGRQSRKFMEAVWSDKAIGRRLAGVYESL